MSWGAVIAGAVATLAVSFVLLVLGSGLGFAAATPWSDFATVAGTLAASAAIWLVVVQWLSAAVGGYLAGRLRTGRANVHTDDAVFRDTAHGFLAWCVSTLLAATFVGSLAIGTVSTGVKATAAVGSATGATIAAAANTDATGYFVDRLLRPLSDQIAPAAKPGDTLAETRDEVMRILTTSLAQGTLTDADRSYLVRLVASRAGISQTDAETRVKEMMAAAESAKQKAVAAADTARTASATAMLASFLALVIGAFISAVAAAFAGRQRDSNARAFR